MSLFRVWSWSPFRFSLSLRSQRTTRWPVPVARGRERLQSVLVAAPDLSLCPEFVIVFPWAAILISRLSTLGGLLSAIPFRVTIDKYDKYVASVMGPSFRRTSKVPGFTPSVPESIFQLITAQYVLQYAGHSTGAFRYLELLADDERDKATVVRPVGSTLCEVFVNNQYPSSCVSVWSPCRRIGPRATAVYYRCETSTRT